jgi:hypothetical protein
MNASNWLEEAVLNHFFRNTSVSATAQAYIALYKTNPGEADNGAEVSGGSYARQPITFGSPTQVSGVGTITNAAAIAFPKATTDWTASNESIGYWGIRTAANGGQLLAYGEFSDSSKANNGKYQVTRDDQYNIGAGQISVRFNQKASYWLQNAVLNHFFRGVTVNSPSQVFLALYISDPTGADVGVEVAYSEYLRQQVTFTAPTQGANEATIANAAALNFPIPSTDVGNVAFFGIRDSQSGGNLLCSAAWSIAKSINAGEQFSVDAGNLEISMA